MLISLVAKKSGLSVDTIRFYEKKGLLGPAFVARRENSYKEYAEATVQRLQLIKSAQAAGFTLSEIARLVEGWETAALTAQAKKKLFEQKIGQIEEKMQDLERIKSYLQQKIALLPAGEIEEMEQ